jgi:hypothetical protein
MGGTLDRTNMSYDGTKFVPTSIDRQEVPARFKRDHRAAHFEETTGTSPEALRAAMSVIERKVLETTDGVVPLDKLMAVYASFNPAKFEDATVVIPGPVASRFVLGAIMDAPQGTFEERLHIAHNMKQHNLSPKLGEKAVRHADGITDERVLKVREYLSRLIVDDDDNFMLSKLGLLAADKLTEFGIEEGPERTIQNTHRAVMYMAGLRTTKGEVREDDMRDGARSAMVARLGNISHEAAALQQVEDAVDDIMANL